ncbi:diguanylate cyclase domain-containing protein [Psychrobacillus sp. NPDC096426]|uniref:sensor domain-containing diguanylate cyclase n=1 Tax=Psychrobacillus sp. NPDC096426 TaxID=3364491 RepID=UPI00382BD037
MLLLLCTIIGILSITLISTYVVTKHNLINDSLNVNENHVQNLSKKLEGELTKMQDKLSLMSEDISYLMDNKVLLSNKLDEILINTDDFYAITVVNKEGVVLEAAPFSGIVAKELETPGLKEPLMKREALISQPFESASGRPIILISTPIWNEDKIYQGYLSGAIYLAEDNFFEDIIGNHVANNGSYVFIVDDKGNVIYHPNKQIIGTNVKQLDVVQLIKKHQSGTEKVTNIDKVEFLAAYQYMPLSKWGIISQTPYDVSVHPLKGIVSKIFFYSIPFVLCILVFTLIIAEKLSSPLRKLAIFANDTEKKEEDFRKVDKPSMWYLEVKQLNETIQEFAERQQERVDDYKERSYTDALTKLKNRRYFEKITKRWKYSQYSFSVIMFDIDHFKDVNDTYGHHTGDEVLQYVSTKMLEVVRENDVCIRLGGEEFIILLPKSNLEQASHVAERLRQNIASYICPTNDYITISAGVTEYQFGESIDELYNRVDASLYRAKTNGRNQIVKAKNKEKT